MSIVKEIIEIGPDGQLKTKGRIRKEGITRLLERLGKLETFDRMKMLEEFMKEFPELSDSAFRYRLQRLLEEGKIERVGRNLYCVSGGQKMSYSHRYSKEAGALAIKVVENFTYVEFRIFEPSQVEELISEGYDSRVLFLSIDPQFFSYASEILRKIYPDQLLEKPGEEEFNGKILYEKEDGWIVLNPLVSEAPRGRERLWHTDMEKMLTDLITDKVLRSLWSDSQLSETFEKAFEKYHIDESKMFRYARRRKGEEKLRNFIKENTTLKLRTVK